ncbi:GSCOCG00012651001-RA-CDS, partial [Cotesia congregata]
TWEDIVSALRCRFADSDYQLSLREEISNRTQAQEESVSQYLACMNGLFARTDPPWSEAKKVKYAHRNMLPSFQL